MTSSLLQGSGRGSLRGLCGRLLGAGRRRGLALGVALLVGVGGLAPGEAGVALVDVGALGGDQPAAPALGVVAVRLAAQQFTVGSRGLGPAPLGEQTVGA